MASLIDGIWAELLAQYRDALVEMTRRLEFEEQAAAIGPGGDRTSFRSGKTPQSGVESRTGDSGGLRDREARYWRSVHDKWERRLRVLVRDCRADLDRIDTEYGR